MKRILVIFIAAALGLSAPATASAQVVRDVIDQVLAQNGHGQGRGGDRDRGRPDRGPPGRGGGRDDRGGDDRGRPDRDGPRGQGRGPQSDWRPAGPLRESPVGREISMSQAIRIVERSASPGHHLDGSREEWGGRPVYRIRWATDRGERRDYIVDAQTGAILR